MAQQMTTNDAAITEADLDNSRVLFWHGFCRATTICATAIVVLLVLMDIFLVH